LGITGLSMSLCKPGALGAPHEAQGNHGSAGPRCAVAEPEKTAYTPPAEGYDAIKDEAFKEVLMRLERSVIEKNTDTKR
jgi:hypothetical protein